MNEDPFDRMCIIIFTVIVFVERMITLMLLEAWLLARQRWEMLWLRGRHALVVICLRMRSLWVHLFYKYIHVSLVLLGVVRPLTWADVEAMRLRSIARSGVDIPRSKELEEGLRMEQETT